MAAALLIGRFTNKIDKKGRVSVPKTFRDALQEQEFPGIYVFPSFRSACIEARSEAEMARITSSVDSMELFSNNHADFSAFVIGNASALSFDPEGRVAIPRELMAHAGITDDALFVGGGTPRVIFQIWNPAEFAKYSAVAGQRLRDGQATLPVQAERAA